jgi:exopolysaccharide biosynthesis polyprenyl glycosylphosphotransferase
VLRKTTLDEAPRIFQTATLMTLALALLDRVVLATSLGKPLVVELWALLFFTMCALRVIARWIVLHVTPAERCVVLGDHEAAQRIEEKLSLSHSMKAELVGRVPLGRETRDAGDSTVVGPLADLDFILRAEHIDRVIIAPNSRDNEETLDTIRLVKALGVKVSVLPRLFEVIGSSVEFDDCDGITLLGVRRYGLSKSSTLLKRAFDVSGAVAALLLFAPLLVAIAVKLTSRGPVFFRQERIGRRGTTFHMFKFRTMVANAEEIKASLMEMNEAQGLFKISEDPRLTRVGRLLRRCSLDELPQLFNVLRGEMSLVGPRPLVPEEDSRIEGWQRRRHDVTPGMTGVWQVLGSSRVPLHEMVKVDYIYRTNWSIWLDIKILLRTVPLVLLRRNV